MKNEIGRELKVSELKPRTVVVLRKETNPTAATMWVIKITDEFVVFTSGVMRTDFAARRTGPKLEQITDNTGVRMHVYEYLGEV